MLMTVAKYCDATCCKGSPPSSSTVDSDLLYQSSKKFIFPNGLALVDELSLLSDFLIEMQDFFDAHFLMVSNKELFKHWILVEFLTRNGDSISPSSSVALRRQPFWIPIAHTCADKAHLAPSRLAARPLTPAGPAYLLSIYVALTCSVFCSAMSNMKRDRWNGRQSKETEEEI
ncbi:uncharacterized protein FOMMEDRAFT_152847 [Fomitiporia mediterranea MF3/22]|uniref:uncharacterized protein n=1 Tax=Fomitiporia mediterranea (strain MF3/22) TaxID=694068 RepID=UPI0004408B29|nr:uncharacterized protein FOMMEDRAFT_152847 [Fomitiporia mediterranea MF3/22]EJD05524.1 hypothetical protein FOMMEDRAFT_152847 [Fomitiporia mediterranea MF3/22]